MSEDVERVEVERAKVERTEQRDAEDTKTPLAQVDSDPNEVLSVLSEISESISRGDIRKARRLLSTVSTSRSLDDLEESERELFTHLSQQLRTDPVELILPLLFLSIWALIFWLTLH